MLECCLGCGKRFTNGMSYNIHLEICKKYKKLVNPSPPSNIIPKNANIGKTMFQK